MGASRGDAGGAGSRGKRARRCAGRCASSSRRRCRTGPIVEFGSLRQHRHHGGRRRRALVSLSGHPGPHEAHEPQTTAQETHATPPHDTESELLSSSRRRVGMPAIRWRRMISGAGSSVDVDVSRGDHFLPVRDLLPQVGASSYAARGHRTREIAPRDL